VRADKFLFCSKRPSGQAGWAGPAERWPPGSGLGVEVRSPWPSAGPVAAHRARRTPEPNSAAPAIEAPRAMGWNQRKPAGRTARRTWVRTQKLAGTLGRPGRGGPSALAHHPAQQATSSLPHLGALHSAPQLAMRACGGVGKRKPIPAATLRIDQAASMLPRWLVRHCWGRRPPWRRVQDTAHRWDRFIEGRPIGGVRRMRPAWPIHRCEGRDPRGRHQGGPFRPLATRPGSQGSRSAEAPPHRSGSACAGGTTDDKSAMARPRIGKRGRAQAAVGHHRHPARFSLAQRIAAGLPSLSSDPSGAEPATLPH